MPILLPSTARLPSVLRRIALSTKTSDSGKGVLETSAEGNNDQGKLAKECRALEMTFQDLASKPRLTALNLDGSVHRWRY